MSNALNLLHRLVEIGQHPEPQRRTEGTYRILIDAELGFEADGGVAPEWLPERSHDSGRQSNAAVDIELKVARVGDE